LLPLARNLIASERLRHAAIAVGIAVLVAVTTILRPLDITVWSLQAKLFDHRPSGEIVFVEAETRSRADALVTANRRLAGTLEAVDAAGAARIFIDLPIQRSGDDAVDERLRGELLRLRDKTVLTRSLRTDFLNGRGVAETDPFFARGLRMVSNDYKTDFLGYVWGIDAVHGDGRRTLPALWTELAGNSGPKAELAPDYAVNVEAIPSFEAENLGTDALSASIRDRAVVLGQAGQSRRVVKIPGSGVVNPSLVHIVAAETALRGGGQPVNWPWTTAFFGLLLALAASASVRARRRRLLYGLLVVSLVATVVVTAASGVRAIFASSIALFIVYACLRLIVRFKRRHLLVEPRSKLPNFVALTRDLSDDPPDGAAAIVVAKIARLDAVFATLTPADQGRYLRQLASRLALGDPEARIYYDGGKYFALILAAAKYEDLQGHLEGLRAIASQSVTVSDRVLDVSMTIGVDRSAEKSGPSRLSSAIAAADQAREAYRPVFIISDTVDDAEEWDYSLQARLESALSQDRISIKLQPQADLRTGQIIGAEALARWVDEERGEIPPARFILQCERVGRLDELTKRILMKSLSAAETLRQAGHTPRISVNVSAIQFVDTRIAELIERCLAVRPADPSRLTIELTETARIEDFSSARSVIEEIKALGVSFSMDDFEVASANLEAMFELPFDEIKIDQLFVQRIHSSPMARAIVANVSRLARETGLTSVAEGIEDQQTFTALREMGVDIGQGYHIARPIVLSELEKTLSLQKDAIAPFENRG
jgi:EAL domain-containing protein (putative c-di-GMP-specific phosphodiesterase class I)/GGDEF domain-containing protein